MNILVLLGIGGAFLSGHILSLLPEIGILGTPLDAGMLIVCCIALWYRVKYQEYTVTIPRSFYLFTVLAFAGVAMNAFRYPLYIHVISWLYFVRWFIGTVLIFGYSVIPVSEQTWIKFLAYISLCFAALGFLQFTLYPDLRNIEYLGWDPHYFRLTSTLFDPNFAGLILVLGVLVWMYVWDNKHVIAGIVAIGLLITALYVTYSRSSYIALLTGTSVYLLLRWFSGKRGILPFVSVMILGIFGGIIMLLPKPGGDTLLLTRMNSTVSRIDNWRQSISLIRSSPVFGYGFNYTPYIPESNLADSGTYSRAGGGIDNSFLLLAVMTGIPGLLLYVWFHFGITRVAFRKGNGISVLFLASQSAIAIHSIFVNSQFYPWILFWYAILAGLVLRPKGSNYLK